MPSETAGDVFLESSNLDLTDQFMAEMKLIDFPDKQPIDLSEWQPVACYVSYKDEETGKKYVRADIPAETNGHMFFNRRAKEALTDFVAPYGQFLPLECKEDELYILNVFNVVDCLDMEKSDIFLRERLDLSDPRPLIDKYVFFEDKVDKNDLFRLPYKNHTDIFFTQNFIKEVEKHDLTGFEYRLLWDSEKSSG